MSTNRLSPVQRQTLIRIADRFGISANLAEIRELPSSVKRDIKIWLGTLLVREGVEDDEISKRGIEIDDLIDLIGY